MGVYSGYSGIFSVWVAMNVFKNLQAEEPKRKSLESQDLKFRWDSRGPPPITCLTTPQHPRQVAIASCRDTQDHSPHLLAICSADSFSLHRTGQPPCEFSPQMVESVNSLFHLRSLKILEGSCYVFMNLAKLRASPINISKYLLKSYCVLGSVPKLALHT